VENVHVHPTSEIEDGVSFGLGTRIWQFAHLRRGSVVGAMVSIGRGVFVDENVVIGDKCKIQNYSQIFNPALIENEVFIGPGVILTNDKLPRATNTDGTQKNSNDWKRVGVVVRKGASIGAGSICVAPVVVGEWSMIAAGSVVTKDVLPFSLVAGNPARFVRWIGTAGVTLEDISNGLFLCPVTQDKFKVQGDGRLLRI
jgi:acetyltransferase-like isoleucine patch superfamily enzyme